MTKSRIIVIEDEEDILELIAFNLERAGFAVEGASSGEIGLEMVRKGKQDLVVLDLMLPGMTGLEVCRRLRSDSATRRIPILIVSAKGEESDIVLGLEAGADDYVTKPFSPKILVARVRAILKRTGSQPPAEDAVVRVHELLIDPTRFRAELGDSTLELTVGEFRLLHFLARHPGWVFTRYQIVNGVHGESYVVTDRAVDVQVTGLRKKLGEHSAYIETVRGVGYRFKE